MRQKLHYILYFLIISLFCSYKSNAQNNIIRGNVYDQTGYIPIPGVGVTTTSGEKAVTDSNGYYELTINKLDSLWFTYKQKNTHKYTFDTISNPAQFDISINYKNVNKTWLPPVFVRNYDYSADSLARRQEYAKIFNPDKGGFKINKDAHRNGGFGLSIDFDELVNVFKFAKNKRLEMYRRFIVRDEEYRYVDHRFSIKEVKAITGMTNEKDIEKFRNIYWPEYAVVNRMSDYQLNQYISTSYQRYKKNKPIEPVTLEGRRYSNPINVKLSRGLQ